MKKPRQIFQAAFMAGFTAGADAMCKLSNKEGGTGLADIKRMEAAAWRNFRTVRNN